MDMKNFNCWKIIRAIIIIILLAIFCTSIFNYCCTESKIYSLQTSNDMGNEGGTMFEIGRKLFDANTITFMCSFLLVVLLTILLSSQEKFVAQNEKMEESLKKLEDQKLDLSAFNEKRQRVLEYSINTISIATNCKLLQYMLADNNYQESQIINAILSQTNNELADLNTKIRDDSKQLSLSQVDIDTINNSLDFAKHCLNPAYYKHKISTQTQLLTTIKNEYCLIEQIERQIRTSFTSRN